MVSNLKRVYNKILRLIVFFVSVNWIKTIYFNFKMLPISNALRLPVFFYGPVTLSGLKGKLIIDAPIHTNMIQFGVNLEMVRTNAKTAQLTILGSLTFKGSFYSGVDYKIIVQPEGNLEIGKYSHFGSNTKVIVTGKIHLGKHTRLSFESQIFDTDFHYMLNTETRQVNRLTLEPIFIDDYCWIGNRCSIMKGTKTPKYLSIASNSLLNKDYTQTIPDYSIIGGMPAKLLRKNIVRIFDPKLEVIISNYFSENNDVNYYILPDNISI